MSYTSVFGGTPIYPSDVSYVAIDLTADTSLVWPSDNGTPAARILDVNATVSGKSVVMPPATAVSVGQTHLFNNVGTQTFIVKGNAGATIASVAPGEVWQIYLRDNTTAGGVWRVFRYGASTATAQASVLAGSGLDAVGSTLATAEHTVALAAGANTINTVMRSKLLVLTGTGSATGNMLSAVSAGDGFYFDVHNGGGGALTLDAYGSETIDGAATFVLQPGESTRVVSNGAQWFTVGFGQSGTFTFDYTAIAVSGGAYTLSGAELNRVAYKFTGVLTSNASIIVPATIQQYWVDNSTTGAFTLTLNTTSGVAVTVPQGTRGVFYCNGTSVVNAATAGLAVPLTASQGGTGQITYAVGDMLYASGASALSRLAPAAAGNTLLSQGASAPVWGPLNLANSVTGVLAPANGGTGLSAVTANRFLYGNGSGNMIISSYLQENSNGVGVGRAAGVNVTLDVGGASGDVRARVINAGTSATDNTLLLLRTSSTGSTASSAGVLFADGDNPDTGSSGRIVYNHGTDMLTFGTNNLDTVVIDKDGRLGVNQLTPGATLDVGGNLRLSVATPSIEFAAGGGIVYAPAGNTLAFATGGGPGSPAERARFVSSGKLLVNTTTQFDTTVGATMLLSGASLGSCLACYMPGTASTSVVSFYNDSGAARVGWIGVSAATTAYNTTSDRRLKTDIKPAGDPGPIIDGLDIVSHGWRGVGDVTVPFGAIAQDLYKLYPQAVHKGDGGRKVRDPWGVDSSKLVFLLWSEIKNLRKRVAALEGRTV